MIKAVFFDIDGTLVPFGQEAVDLSVLEALDRVRAKGVKVFISSGRPIYFIKNLRDYSFDGYVCCNGGVVFVDGQVVFSKPMDPDDVRSVVEVSEAGGVGCYAFAAESRMLNFRSELSDSLGECLHIGEPPVGDLFEFIRRPVYQFTVYATEQMEREMYAPAVKHSIFPRWHPRFMDVTPDDVSKADGIARVAGLFGWNMDELMAFGDGGNDIPMLQAVGTGVAMGNAEASVKEYAAYVTADVRDGGIVKALRHFGLV